MPATSWEHPHTHHRFHRWAGIIHPLHVQLHCGSTCVVLCSHCVHVCVCVSASLTTDLSLAMLHKADMMDPLCTPGSDPHLCFILQSGTYCFDPQQTADLPGISPCIRGLAGLWNVQLIAPWSALYRHSVQGYSDVLIC